MENLQKIALLIDADNTQLSKLEDVIQEISTYGRIVVKRAYGNWKKENLKNWENELKRLAFRAEQQFDYVSGKNATDMALVIDAINLLHANIYDAFVIVTSDSDFTPLAISLHESGVYVIGVGESKTPEPFRKSCDEFILLENLGVKEPIPALRAGEIPPAEGAVPVKGTGNDIDEIHNLLKVACATYQDDNGYAYVAAAGNFIKRAKSDYDPRTYGYEKLSSLIKAFPERYRIRDQTETKGMMYCCK